MTEGREGHMLKKVGGITNITKKLNFRIVGLVCCIIFPVLVAMLLFNLYSINVVEKQVSISAQNTLTFYVNQLDERLETWRQNVLNTATNNEDVLILDRVEEGNERTLAKVRLKKTLKQYIAIYGLIDMSFYYDPDREVQTTAYDSALAYEERMSIWKYIRDTYTVEAPRSTAGWKYAEIDGEYFLILVAPSKNGIVGAAVSCDKIVEPLRREENSLYGTVFLTSDQGEPLVQHTGLEAQGIDQIYDANEADVFQVKGDYIAIRVDSTAANVAMVSVVDKADLLRGLPQLHNVLIIICGIAAMGIILLLWTLRRIIIRPLHILVNAMRDFGCGDFTVRIKDAASSEEMTTAYNSFNRMSQEISDLKIKIYEEQIKKQETELRCLQMQVDPHFYINCINIIYGLAEQNDYKMVQKMSVLLSDYFRCVFADNGNVVPLKSELRQMSIYMEIQGLRYPHQITYEEHIPEYLQEVKLPRFVLMTFIENSVKHGINREYILCISVSAKLSLVEKDTVLEIVIADNGGGFPEDILGQLQQSPPALKTGSGHIGIYNVIQRLKMMYGNTHKLWFDNVNGGAQVKLCIPLKSVGEE